MILVTKGKWAIPFCEECYSSRMARGVGFTGWKIRTAPAGAACEDCARV